MGKQEEDAIADAAAAAQHELPEKDVQEVEKILGYEFFDRSLVVEALTHRSFYFPKKPTVTYERLEFLGDAVLTCLVAREVFFAYPTLPQGPLTKLRAANVDTEKLARVAVAHGLHRFIRHKVTQLDAQVQEFIEAMLYHPIHSNGLLDPPKMLADIIESLIGAIFVDTNSSFETVWKVYRRLAEPLINPDTLGKHPVSELLELCQKYKMEVTFLGDASTESIANKRVRVLVDGKFFGNGGCGNKKEIAQNRAAKVALDLLKKALEDQDPTPTKPDLFS